MSEEGRQSGYATREQCKLLLDESYEMKRCCCRCEFFEAAEEVTSTYCEAASILRGKPTFKIEYSGFCHRFPPANQDHCESLSYPYVTEADWCGEFVELEKKLEVDDVCAAYLDEEDSE